jgi:1-acyl-sn-glycerol-3-phosphate acyltransferase
VAAVRAVHGAAMRRWDRHLLRVPWQNATASTIALRAWRQTAATRPLLVFPEGRLSVDLEPVRPGAGAWLARGSAPVVPVGVWWDGDAWRVRIGPPIAWSARDDLRDAQLQLSLAAVLPPALTQRWAPALAAWRAHRAAAVRAA